MTSLRILFQNVKDETGVTIVEYAAMLVLIAIAVMVAAPNISADVLAVFGQIGGLLNP